MRALKTYHTLEPTDWTASTIFTEARDRVVVASDGKPWAVYLASNGWRIHAADGPMCVSGLNIWDACRFLNDRQARPLDQ